MALKAVKLGKMFGKLTPYADDVARGAYNYGDDALRLASNYGDEALDYGLDVAKYADNIPGDLPDIPMYTGTPFERAPLPHDAHVGSYQQMLARNHDTASNILENAAFMRLNASDATADALTRLNRKYPTVYDNFYDLDDSVGYTGLAVGPFTDVSGYVDYSNPSVAHAGNRKLMALYEKLGLDRYGYEPDELPF